MQTALLKIKGMNTPAAARGVCSALSVIRGVTQVYILEDAGETLINYDPRKVLPKQFVTAVSVVGCAVGEMIFEPFVPPVAAVVPNAETWESAVDWLSLVRRIGYAALS